MLMESRVKFLSPKKTAGVSQEKCIASNLPNNCNSTAQTYAYMPPEASG